NTWRRKRTRRDPDRGENKKGIKADAIDLTEFVDFVKLNKLQTDCFVIGQKNQCKLFVSPLHLKPNFTGILRMSRNLTQTSTIGIESRLDTAMGAIVYWRRRGCQSNAGYFVNAKDVSGESHIEEFYKQVVALHGSANHLPASCTSRLSPGLCFFPENVAGQIKTPLFIINSAYDSWQITNILVPDDADPKGTWSCCKVDIKTCSSTQLQTMQGFRVQFLNALSELGNSSSRGMLIDSCYTHCRTEYQEAWLSADSPVLDKTSIAKAVGDWYYDRSPFQKIDCPYPCNPLPESCF
ncbi:hypothetical protein CUMW_281370, partial [Citrus unshiu]